MTTPDLRPLRRAIARKYAKRTLRKIAMRTSYTLSALCFLGAAITCGDSDYPIKVIVAIMVAFLVGMMAFYKLAEVLRCTRR